MQIPAAKIVIPEEDRSALLKRFDEILKSGQLTLGKYGKEFESKFADHVETQYATAVNSGTSALEIILRALNLQGKSVVVPTNTFFATVAAVVHAGAQAVLCDVDDSLCMDFASLQANVQDDTRAVIVVHIGGIIAPQIAEIKQFCDEKNLHLIEDAAHAHGSTYDGKKAGSFGVAGAFSFYPTKVITAAEGGMITTNDGEIHKRAMVFRDQGKAGFLGNMHTEMGYNWRMSELHAALGLSQFARLEQFIEQRQAIARLYDAELRKNEYLTPLALPNGMKSNYYKYIALLEPDVDRHALKSKLREVFDVSLSGEVYELPCHLQPVFETLSKASRDEFPMAEDVCQRHICLPLFPGMTEDEATYVVRSLEATLP
jgi:dTDP-4-amino-4,6-dideoxygalactose transaminase